MGRKRIRRSHLKRFASDNIQIRASRIVPHHIRDITREHYRHQVETNAPDPILTICFPGQPMKASNCIVLVKRRSERLMLYWNNTYTQFYFVKVVFKLVLKSIVYPDREYAMRKHGLGKIVWIEKKRMQPTEVVGDEMPVSISPTPQPPVGTGQSS